MCAYVCLYLTNTCEHVLCESVLLWTAYTWTLLAVELCSRPKAERGKVREVSPGIKGQGRLWIIYVMDEERPSSPSRLHTENSSLTQLLSNIPRLNPHLSFCLPPILLDCFNWASVTISHISVFMPAISKACGSLLCHLKIHLVYGLSLNYVKFMYISLYHKHASKDFMETKPT